MRAAILVLLAVLLTLPAALAGGAGEDSPSPQSHLLVLLALEQGVLTIEQVDLVAGAPPKQRDRKRAYPWRVRVLGAKGRLVFQAGLDDPTVLRGEFHHRRDPNRIEAVHLRQTGKVFFSVRLPAGSAGRLEFDRLVEGAPRQPDPPAAAWERIGSLKLSQPGDRP